MNAQATQMHKNIRFEFADHPWISIFAFWLFTTILMLLFAIIYRLTGSFNPGIGFLLMVVVVAPLAMRIPRTKQGFRAYLDDIRASKTGPAARYFMLALISYYREYLEMNRKYHHKEYEAT